jgi:transcriptional regulator with XRE-family HTH domain
MLHDDIKRGRMAAGLSVAEVARASGLPRQRVYSLERGENVTIDTIRRIVSVIPNLRVTLGEPEPERATASIDLDAARRAAFGLFDVATQLIRALGVGPAAPQQSVSTPQQSAAAPEQRIPVHFASGSESERQTAARLDKMVDQGEHKKKRRSNS